MFDDRQHGGERSIGYRSTFATRVAGVNAIDVPQRTSVVARSRPHDKPELLPPVDADAGGVHKVTRIDLHDEEGARLWCLALGADETALRTAVAAVGDDAQRVFDYLKAHVPGA